MGIEGCPHHQLRTTYSMGASELSNYTMNLVYIVELLLS